ncbi:Uncharacterised protein [Vibrio cholerae]|nr:Uncharacterised protein [Vibrio cholerae]
MVLELTATVDCGYAAIALRQCLAFGTFGRRYRRGRYFCGGGILVTAWR